MTSLNQFGGLALELTITVDADQYRIEVPDEVVAEGEDFFARMDADMDRGWQMSREWVEQPGTRERCQIAADKILTALHTENEALSMMMAGYILSRLPGVTGVRIINDGDMATTEFDGAPGPV